MTSDEEARWFVMWRPAFTWVVEGWHATREEAEEAMRKKTGDMLVAKVVAFKSDAEDFREPQPLAVR